MNRKGGPVVLASYEDIFGNNDTADSGVDRVIEVAWGSIGTVYLSEYFTRNSIFPEKADLSDTVDDYISRRRSTLPNRDSFNAMDEAEDAQEDEFF